MNAETPTNKNPELEDTEHTETEEQTDEGGSGSQDVTTPFSPHEDDDSALGDSDQHSTA